MTDPVVLYSSRRGVATAVFSPAVLLAISVGTAITRPVTASVVVIGAIGVALAVVVAWDYPLRSEFTEFGIVRVCPLRRQHLPWDRVVAIERAPGRARIRPKRDSEVGAFRVPSGLVARVGRRRYLLTDQSEGAFEYDQLAAAIKTFDDVVMLRATRPPLTALPTTFSRRRREERL